jgi:hypothetical protein
MRVHFVGPRVIGSWPFSKFFFTSGYSLRAAGEGGGGVWQSVLHRVPKPWAQPWAKGLHLLVTPDEGPLLETFFR